MTEMEIDAVLGRVKAWPEPQRSYAASVLVELERDMSDVYTLSDEERGALDEGEASGVASKEEVAAVFRRWP